MIGKSKDRNKYRDRCQYQALQWALGHPFHNNIDNECCPDFSCCTPDIFEQDASKRWELYHKQYGGKH